MQPLLRKQKRFLPYILGFFIILMGYQYFSYTVTEQSPVTKETKLKVATTKKHQEASYALQVQDPTKDTYDYSILARRASKILEICSQSQVKDLMGHFPSQHDQHVIVDDTTKVLFCYVPKVACTNFKRVFLGLAGVIQSSEVDILSGYDVHFTHVNKLKFLKDYSRSEIRKRMREYQKFMFVRDPLERLVSAYRSKLIIHPNPDSRAYFLQKIQAFYIEYSVREKQRKVLKRLRNGIISFQEFLYYILDHLELEGQVNEHFVPIVTLCNPCEVKYNFVGSYEPVNKEANFIFGKLGIPHHFPGKNDNYSSIETKELVESYYENLPSDLIRSVWEIFKKDYVIFDMPIPTWLVKYTI